MKSVDWENKRVRVYATLNGTVAESAGTVTQIRIDGMLHVRLDVGPRHIVAHPKQCRILVRKTGSRYRLQELLKIVEHEICCLEDIGSSQLMDQGRGKLAAWKQMRDGIAGDWGRK